MFVFFSLSAHYFEDVFVQVDDCHDEQSCHKPDECEGDGSHGYRLATSEKTAFGWFGTVVDIVL